MIIDALRAATKQSHTELDHLVYPKIQQIHSTEQYVDLLKLFYGYFKPVQDVINKHLDGGLIPFFASRRKPQWILDDIFFFTGSVPAISLAADLPVIGNTPAAFGAYYVLEGSTMGGSIIKRKIMENLGLQKAKGLSFFAGYGDNNKTMWNNFLDSLENSPQNHEEKDVLIKTAEETFSKFTGWIKQSSHES